MAKRLLIIIVFITTCCLTSLAQVSVSGGASMLKPFGIQKVYPGLHINLEFTEDDLTTFYGKVMLFPASKIESDGVYITANDPNTVPYTLQIKSYEKYNYGILELGKRYYFGEGFESGFFAYGSSNLSFIINQVRYETEDYDRSKYTSSIDEDVPSSIMSMALGLNGGIKNSYYFGTLYLDAGINLTVLSVPSKNLSYEPSSYSNLFFIFSIGYRKIFY